MRLSAPLLAHAERVLTRLLEFSAPADQVLSGYFREHRAMGRADRAFVAETSFAILRRKRSLESALGSGSPRDLLVGALVRFHGLSVRAVISHFSDADPQRVERLRSLSMSELAPAVQADLPDWLWERLERAYGSSEAMEIARGMLNGAPLDLRVNLLKKSRDEVLAALQADGIEASATPYSPTGIRLKDKPAINRHPLFLSGAIEVQDEGSQLLAYLVAPRRGEMVVDFCAGAGGKTLALAALMRGAGRIYAMDVSARRLRELAPRAARAGVSNIHPLALSDENDLRARRLSGKIDRVLVDAPCSGFGTLRRNPDLKWRHGSQAIEELSDKQRRILAAAARFVKAGGCLVYATCSVLPEENELVVDGFLSAHPEFEAVSCAELFASQRISIDSGPQLRLWPHRHGTDGFYAAAFRRRP